jgi:hypothetical protein
MINILVKFDSEEQSRSMGVSMGYIPADEPTPTYINGIDFLVIGKHSYLIGDGEDVERVDVDGWWVRMQAEEDTPIPPEIAARIVEPKTNVGTDEEPIWVAKPEVPQNNWM